MPENLINITSTLAAQGFLIQKFEEFIFNREKKNLQILERH